MSERYKKTFQWCGLVLAILAAAIVMGNFNMLSMQSEEPLSAERKSDAQPVADNIVPEATVSVKSLVASKNYLDTSEDGFMIIDGYLYEVDSAGDVKCNFSDGILYFSSDGRYTSGDAELDKLVAEIIVSQTAENASRIDMLKALYAYVRDNMEYVGYVDNNYSYTEPDGVDGWGNTVAREALACLAGNCYYYNSAFAALARGLGYQAYIVTGTCGLPPRTHCWCEIEYENMVYYCDPELEWSRSVYQQEDADIFFKDWSQTEGWCYAPNVKRQSEAKAAEDQAKYDAMIEYAKAHPSPRPTIAPTSAPVETSAPVQTAPAETPASAPQPIEQPTNPEPIPDTNPVPAPLENATGNQSAPEQGVEETEQAT